jgi:arylsulfatase A-like enzyme
MTRRDWIRAAVAAAPLANGQTSRPNVVIFLADDLGFHDVGYQGSEIRTPNIDRLAEGGVRFRRLHSFPLCSPTRAGLLTGRHPIRFGLAYSVVRPWSHYGLSISERTIANVFKEAGYQTAITGKWHLGHTHVKLLPASRGFDHFYGHVNGAIDYFTHTRGAAVDWQRNGSTIREQGYSTDLIAAEASRWIRARDRSRPFFLYVPWNAPHTPLQAPDDLLNRYSAIADKRRRTYAAMVDAMDRGIGQIVRTLEQEDIRKDTLVLFLSDNGGPRGSGANNGSLRAGKATVYEGGLRVPALLNWDGRLKPGATDQVCTVLDVLPTIAAAAGVPVKTPQPLDGVNLWPGLSTGKVEPRDELFFAVQGDAGPKQHALRLGDFKLVSIDGREQLFNIADDSEEKNDLAAQNPKQTRDLRTRMEKWIALHPPGEIITTQHAHPGWVPPADWAQAAVK